MKDRKGILIMESRNIEKTNIEQPKEKNQPRRGDFMQPQIKRQLLNTQEKGKGLANDAAELPMEIGELNDHYTGDMRGKADKIVKEVISSNKIQENTRRIKKPKLKDIVQRIEKELENLKLKKQVILDEKSDCKSGTMRYVDDNKTIEVYVGRLDSVSDRKTEFFLSHITKETDALVVDVGCMTGKVLQQMSKERPKLRFEGIDSEERYIQKAQEAYPKHKFRTLKLPNDMPYRDNEVDAFTMSALLHEVYTYNGFSEKAVKESLREMYRTLKPEGRVIIREPAMPQNPNELLNIKLTSKDGANPNTDEELLAAIPRDLSSESRMRRFLLQFKPLHLPQNQAVKDQITKNPDGSYKSHAWLISEFLRKRQCDPKEFWNAEMGEHNGPFIVNDLKRLAEEAGFQQDKMQIHDLFEKNWYAEIKKDEGISITDSKGKSVNQAERLPSHIYAILEK
jgi:SAM-dependent methyltransferase